MPKLPKRRSYTLEQKAAALGRVGAGEQPAIVARDMGLTVGTVESWASRERPTELASAKKESIGEALVAYLALALDALQAQMSVASDPAYCRRQNAHDLAILHGVIADKADRLVKSMQAASSLQQ